jgi:2-succinyl-5-enolpyruvyl-6-hydroxy-3-cyclohexene-1-carboxylate synthase
VVRLIDALAQLPAGYPVYSNRGASGIDGLLATAAGVQRASARRRWRSSAIFPRSTISTRWRCCVRRLRRWC